MIRSVRYLSCLNIPQKIKKIDFWKKTEHKNKLHILYMIIRNNNLYPVLIGYKILIML